MDYRIIEGDCIESMRTMPDASVHTCVTSPPYFGLRDYGVDGQIGLEQTPDEYVAALVAVFREVRRVLRDDGTLWLNLGDSYAGAGYSNHANTGGAMREDGGKQKHLTGSGLKNKDLIGIPWRVAFALQADGWCLRQDIIWHKPNPMPESVRDRCTKAHEYIFLLSKAKRYYFDSEAMQEPATGAQPGNKAHKYTAAYEDGSGEHRTKAGLVAYAERQRSKRDSFKREGSKREQTIPGQYYGTHRPDREESAYDTGTRNRRSVWTVATKPYKGAHFATFPPDLIRPCILAGCPKDGTVLDPFGGSGTTALVALEEGRKAVLCELNPDYIALAQKRLEGLQLRIA
jgi:DNA modification methylase